MFSHTLSFNGDLSNWDSSSVRSITSFNGDLSNWDSSSITSMEWMFSMTPPSMEI